MMLVSNQPSDGSSGSVVVSQFTKICFRSFLNDFVEVLDRKVLEKSSSTMVPLLNILD